MDDYAVTAILAVPTELSGSDIEQFFNLIIEMYADGDGPPSLDDFARAVGDREPSFGNAAERFRETLTSQGIDGRWVDIAGTLVREGGSGSNLVTLHDQYAAQLAVPAEQVPTAETANGQAAAVDWETFRQANQDFWSTWDGSNWATWRAAFTSRVPNELHAELDPHLTWLDSLDPAAQMAYLRDNLGFAINYTAPPVAAETAPVDWQTFQQANQDFWSTWDGSNWATWRAAFTSRVPNELHAELDPHLTWLDSLDPAAQMAYLRDNLGFPTGVDTSVAAEELAAEELAPEATPEQLAQATEALLEAGETVPEEITPELAAEVFAEVPEAAQLSPEVIAEVMREVAAETQA